MTEVNDDTVYCRKIPHRPSEERRSVSNRLQGPVSVYKVGTDLQQNGIEIEAERHS